jgi:hypothetical protein
VRSLLLSCRRVRRPARRLAGSRGYFLRLATLCAITAALLVASASAWANRAQTAETLSQVKKIYVGSLGDKHGSTELRDRLIKRLRKARGVEVVTIPGQANAFTTGTGEVC